MRRWALIPAVLLGAVSGGVLVKKVWLDKYRRQKSELNMTGRERDLLHTRMPILGWEASSY